MWFAAAKNSDNLRPANKVDMWKEFKLLVKEKHNQ